MKQQLIALLCAVSFFAASVSAAAQDGYYLRGDADGDGEISIVDATVIQRKLAKIEIQAIDERAADVDGNGTDISDATEIQRYLVKLQTTCPIGESVPVPAETTALPTDPYELPFIPA